MATPVKPVAMATRMATPRGVALACDICLPSELAAQSAHLALLSIWHMHGARIDGRRGHKALAAARVARGLAADEGARAMRAELLRRAGK